MLSRNIVITTDLSEASIAGVAAGAQLVREQGGSATLVHVLPIPALHVDAGQLEQPHAENAELEAAVHQHLDRLRTTHFGDLPDVKTALVRSPSPADAICRFAEEQGASLIVIATRGRTGLARFLIGGVTERVVRHAPCPVLVVR